MMSMGACMALAQGAACAAARRVRERRRDGGSRLGEGVGGVAPVVVFASAASVLALPQMFWATRESAVNARAVLRVGVRLGHGRDERRLVLDKEHGGLHPSARRRARVARGGRESKLLSFTCRSRSASWCRTSTGSRRGCGTTSRCCSTGGSRRRRWWRVLARLWRRGRAWRAAAVGLLFVQTAAGGLDVWRAASGAVERRSFDRTGWRSPKLSGSETPRAL